MTRATDDARPPSASYHETYLRHRKLCWLPIVLGILAAAGFLLTSAHRYQSTASIWVDTAAPTISSVGADGSPSLTEPPASSEQGILTELLTTDSFADSVARSSVLGKDLGSAAAIRAQAPKLLEHGHVSATPTGGQVLNISYTGSSPEVAQSVLGGVVTQLRDYNNSFATQHGEAALAYDREQVSLAEAAQVAATKSVNTYLTQHPDANRSDPSYLSLSDAENNAVTALSQANAALNQAAGARSADGWSIRVIDAPGPAVSQAPGKKKILGVLFGGAFGGLVVALLAIVMLTPARRVDWEDDLPLGEPSVPVALPGGPYSGDGVALPSRPYTGDGVALPSGPYPGDAPMPSALGRGPLVAATERLFAFGILSEQMDEP